MGKPLTLKSGERFNRWTIISIKWVAERKKRIARVRCDCGAIKKLTLFLITSGISKSCGCYNLDRLKKPRTHGLSKHPLYIAWINMKSRCYNKKCPAYKDYGARGITMSKLWKRSFLSFYRWAIKNGWREWLQIDRRNNNKGYSHQNCRIVTSKINCGNTRRSLFLTYKGKRKTIYEWSETTGLSYGLLRYRLVSLRLPPAKILSKKIRGRL